MSDWRITIRELSDLGGAADSDQFGTYRGRRECQDMGLAKIQGRAMRDQRQRRWVITKLGKDWVDGRVQLETRGNPGKPGRAASIWRATWLAALPKWRDSGLAGL